MHDLNNFGVNISLITTITIAGGEFCFLLRKSKCMDSHKGILREKSNVTLKSLILMCISGSALFNILKSKWVPNIMDKFQEKVC